jgi:hypothetical protein
LLLSELLCGVFSRERKDALSSAIEVLRGLTLLSKVSARKYAKHDPDLDCVPPHLQAPREQPLAVRRSIASRVGIDAEIPMERSMWRRVASWILATSSKNCANCTL